MREIDASPRPGAIDRVRRWTASNVGPRNSFASTNSALDQLWWTRLHGFGLPAAIGAPIRLPEKLFFLLWLATEGSRVDSGTCHHSKSWPADQDIVGTTAISEWCGMAGVVLQQSLSQ